MYKTKIENFIKVVSIPKYVLWDNGVTDFGSLIAAVLFCILGKLPWKNIHSVIMMKYTYLDRKYIIDSILWYILGKLL